MSLIVGIDTGAKGGVAFMDRASGAVLHVEDMPADAVLMGKTERLRVSDYRLLAVLRGTAGHAFVEKPEGRPISSRNKANGIIERRPPGAQGMLALGEAYGIAKCACTAIGLAVTDVSASEWKTALRVPAAKDQARRIAIQLYPAWAQAFSRVKDDGRAEAVLICRYARWKLDGVLT